MEFLKKLKIEVLYDPAIALQVIYLKKTITGKHMCTLMFIIALFIIAKTWKIARRNINNLIYDDTTRMAEREEELKSLLMKVKEESEKVG